MAITREQGMSMSREEILARYRQLRTISRQHHSAALKFLATPTILDQARRLGLAAGKGLVAESEDELTLVFDLAIHSPIGARSRAIDRYRKAARLAPESDAAKVLEAMCRADFSLWRIERRHETAGLIVFDVLRQSEAWLMDEGLEQSAEDGMAIAMRLFTPETFAMTAGVIVPVDRDIVETAFDLMASGPEDPDALARAPRFAMAVYRAALALGAMENVTLK